MKEVWVNHKVVDFLNAIKQHKIAAGCGLHGDEEQPQLLQHHHNLGDELRGSVSGGGSNANVNNDDDDGEGYVNEHIMEDDEDDRPIVENLDPCINNKCRGGSKCVPQSPSDYTCQCPAGRTGKFCEQGNQPPLNCSG